MPARTGHCARPADTASSSRERHRARSTLVVAGRPLVLLISSALMIRTFLAPKNVEPAFASPARC
jgi:hypothetical protein